MTRSAFRLAQFNRLPSEHAKLGVAARREVITVERLKKDANIDSDSEDEEVAVSCFRGLREKDEFDSSDDDDESSNATDDELDEPHSAGEGVVRFVSRRVAMGDSELVKPTPSAAKAETFSFIKDSVECCVKSRLPSFSLYATGGSNDEEEIEEVDMEERDDESQDSLSSLKECDELDMVSRVVSECTDGSISDTIGFDYFALGDSDNDDELSEILENLAQSSASGVQDDMETSERYIGVKGDSEVFLSTPKAKRVLSYNTLSELSEEGKLKVATNKRPRLIGQPSSLLTALVLNTAAMYQKPAISADEEDELYSTMKEELLTCDDSKIGAKKPIPLLTPPSSPFTMSIDGDVPTAVCEWPSNLVVDSAMTAACELSPLSLASLEDLELRDTDFSCLAC
ncbi:hypothetical protein FisN_1Lh560 [Fistulifera solaris]|uniref:Uncharacterized protein n=1 Tax=Fistulifera solaris TaxID=1519565 RepID=A0A1Z5K1H8_FISSO|nr:hypothetical protein FisN_1Lh560 [Fistulifera solaris]|eukprot:GAX19966.1 hypothetical protein FisN_1Lh560 [Fistulifera solaris]